MAEEKLLRQIDADNRSVIQAAKQRWENETHPATRAQRRVDYEKLKGILSGEPATNDEPVTPNTIHTAGFNESAAQADAFAKEFEAIATSHRNSMDNFETTARKVKIVSGIVAVVILLLAGLSLST